MTAILNGVKVVEVAAWTYVPMAGAVLAEWGAEVIKIEHPETGDPQRGLVSSGLVPGGGGVNHMIEVPNRGKKSVGLDMASPGGREVLLRLVAEADVFLTNFLPAVRRKLGIDVDDIRAANPNIIYVRGSANGQRGPEAERGGYDLATFWSRGGSADIATPPGQDYPFMQPGPAYGDVLGGLTLAGGVTAALLHRDRTGEALVVDNSLLAMGMWATGATLAGAGLFGIDRLPFSAHDQMPNPLVNYYRTKDDRYLLLNMLQYDRFWPELVTAAGRPELADDPASTRARPCSSTASSASKFWTTSSRAAPWRNGSPPSPTSRVCGHRCSAPARSWTTPRPRPTATWWTSRPPTAPRSGWCPRHCSSTRRRRPSPAHRSTASTPMTSCRASA